MKRKILLLLLAAMGVLMAACQQVMPPVSQLEPSATVTDGTEPSTAPQIPTQTETTEPTPIPMVCYRDIPYGDHPLQTMDIYIPEGDPQARYPVMLTIHGGEWKEGDKKDSQQYTAPVIASNCIHVAINHRLLYNGISRDAERPYEEMLDDIDAAFAFLVQNAQAYQIDTTRAGIGGYSSGGYLALMYAYTRTQPPIPLKFVLSEAGSANFMDPKTFSEDGETWLHESHDGHEDIEVWPMMPWDYRLVLIGEIVGVHYCRPGWEEAWKQASPAYVVTPDAPQTFLFYGTHDAMVPISHAELLAQNHPNCSLYEVMDATHHLYSQPKDLESFQSWLQEILKNL